MRQDDELDLLECMSQTGEPTLQLVERRGGIRAASTSAKGESSIK